MKYLFYWPSIVWIILHNIENLSEKLSYLEWNKPNEIGEAVSGHEPHGCVLVAHPPHDGHNKQDKVRHHVNTELVQ